MKKIGPPKWADRFLEWYCNPELLEEIQGDAYELYYRTLKTQRLVANIQFIWNVFRFLRWSNIKRTKKSSAQYSSTVMFTNYFTIFKRNLLRQKGYSFLNLFGLAIGIACFLLICFYVEDEMSYDRFHSKADRIYRIHQIHESDGVGERSASLPFPVGETIVNDYGAQVESSVRFFNFQLPTLALSTVDNTKSFNEHHVFLTDSTLFDVFDFNLIKGNKKTALDAPRSILLTESMAQKYFGGEDPIGKYLKFQGAVDLLVTGVLQDCPDNTHFQFDFLISFSTIRDFESARTLQDWYWNPCWTYVLLKNRSYASTLQAFFPAFVKKYFPAHTRDDNKLLLFPLTDIHLKSHMDYEIAPNSNISTLYVFSSVAVVVILIASFNFINLSTARAARRAKEVGMRKALGSKKSQLVGQFLFESVVTCLLAAVLAVGLLAIALPSFNALAEKSISLTRLFNPFFAILLFFLPLAVGTVSGIYPAFVLSSFRPVIVLKGNLIKEKGILFRKALVVLQFSLSVILIICTGVAIDQLNLLQKGDTGFTQENILMIPVSRTPIGKNYETLKNEFLRNPGILSVTAMEDVLGSKHQTNTYRIEGMDKERQIPNLHVRHDFLKTFDISIVAGRDHADTDSSHALIVNEQFVKEMGWKSNEDAVGRKTPSWEFLKIVGVMKDINFNSRHQPVKPFLIRLTKSPRAFDLFLKYMAVRISPQNIPASIEWLSEKWKAQMPGWPFEYFFLKDELDNLYKAEAKQSKVVLIFSGLSILVACLGLFGLATFTAEQRKKEMSIRKVLGSADSQIFFLFSKQFFGLVLIANVVAFPAAYLLLKQWLSGFAYRVNIDWSLFLFAALVSIAIAVITICYQGLRTAHANPAEVLKNE